jgi:hypothetical protein
MNTEDMVPRVKEYVDAVKARGNQEDIDATTIAVCWMIICAQVENPSPNPTIAALQKELLKSVISEQIARLHSPEWVEKHLKPVSALFHKDVAQTLERARAEREQRRT